MRAGRWLTKGILQSHIVSSHMRPCPLLNTTTGAGTSAVEEEEAAGGSAAVGEVCGCCVCAGCGQPGYELLPLTYELTWSLGGQSLLKSPANACQCNGTSPLPSGCDAPIPLAPTVTFACCRSPRGSRSRQVSSSPRTVSRRSRRSRPSGCRPRWSRRTGRRRCSRTCPRRPWCALGSPK